MVLTNILSVIVGWEQIRIEDTNGNLIYEGACANFRATTDPDELYKTLIRTVERVISFTDDNDNSYISITIA